jgi:hypothetical protein
VNLCALAKSPNKCVESGARSLESVLIRGSDRDSLGLLMRGPYLLSIVIFFGAIGCPDDDQECQTTQDCFDQGRTLTQCIGGQCQRQCELDIDCGYLSGSCAQDDMACLDELATLMSTKFICEDFVCLKGCPDVACPAGARCVDGRCGYFDESFEPDNNGDFVTLEGLGWNSVAWPLTNTRLVVAWSGDGDCTLVGDRDRCAGPAAKGSYFAVVQRSQATARAPRTLGMTCRDCACCLACRDPLSRTSTTSLCPGLNDPNINMCSSDVHADCQSVCDSCAQCPDETAGVVAETGLNSCELQTAPKACAACLVYDKCLADKQAENRACPGDATTYPECMGDTPSERTQADCDRCLLKECASLEDACLVCRKAGRLKATHPDEPELWRTLEASCDSLGADACYEIPKATIRSDLTSDEQALESPGIDLTKASDPLVLQFEFVAYNLKETYIRVIQGEDEAQWPVEKERVLVQLCAKDCDNPSSWKDGAFDVTNESAIVPADGQRNNGLLYTQQNKADWKLNRRHVIIPDNMKTKDFRFRFVPFLSQDSRVAIDNIIVRRRK